MVEGKYFCCSNALSKTTTLFITMSQCNYDKIDKHCAKRSCLTCKRITLFILMMMMIMTNDLIALLSSIGFFILRDAFINREDKVAYRRGILNVLCHRHFEERDWHVLDHLSANGWFCSSKSMNLTHLLSWFTILAVGSTVVDGACFHHDYRRTSARGLSLSCFMMH